jgi:hypothetical protein
MGKTFNAEPDLFTQDDNSQTVKETVSDRIQEVRTEFMTRTGFRPSWIILSYDNYLRFLEELNTDTMNTRKRREIAGKSRILNMDIAITYKKKDTVKAVA